MVKIKMFHKALFFVAIMLLAGCTPKPGMPPMPASQSTPSNSGQVNTSVVTTSDGDAAWSKVVEAAKKEGKVTFYSVSIIGDDAQVLLDAFNRKYGIKVELISGLGTSNAERLATERRMGQMTGDVVQASVGNLIDMKKMSLLGQMADLPVVKDKGLWQADPLVIDPDGYIVPYQGSWQGPLINTKLVPRGTEPKSLRDLLKPEWKGRILFVHPRTSTVSHIYYVAFINRGLLDWSYLESLGKQDLAWSQGSVDTPRMIAQGERSIANWVSASSAAPMVLEGAPIKALSMEEGDPYNPMAIGLVGGAPPPNAAKVFLNWMYSKEAAILTLEKTKSVGADSLLKDVPSATPEPLIPPLKKKIIYSQKDLEEGAKLYREQYLIKLWGLK